MQIHSPSELPLHVHTIWRSWLCPVSLKSWPGNSLTRELHPRGAWKGITLDPPSVLLKRGAQWRQQKWQSAGAALPLLPCLELLELGAVIDLFGGSEHGGERPSRSVHLINCITIAWDIARFTMNSWLQNTGWWAPGALGSGRGKTTIIWRVSTVAKPECAHLAQHSDFWLRCTLSERIALVKMLAGSRRYLLLLLSGFDCNSLGVWQTV